MKEKEVHREKRPIGICFFGGGRNGLPGCFMKYETTITYQNDKGYRQKVIAYSLETT